MVVARFRHGALALLCALLLWTIHASAAAASASTVTHPAASASTVTHPAANTAAATTKNDGPSGTGPVVVVGFSGVLWNNLSAETTPHLWKFIDRAGNANIVVRTVGETTCPAAGWLTLSAGQRTTDATGACEIIPSPEHTESGLHIPGWGALRNANEQSSYQAEIGLLGDEIAGVDALAIGPGAALALAQSDGVLSTDYVDVDPLPGSTEDAPHQDTARDAAADAYKEAAAGKDLIVVDLGAVRYPDALLEPTGSTQPAETSSAFEKMRSAFAPAAEVPDDVDAEIAALDARFGALLEQIEAVSPNATVIVTSVGDSQEITPQLGFFAAVGPRIDTSGTTQARLISSDATRQLGLIQLTDLLPTLLTWIDPQSPALEHTVGSALIASSDSIGSGADAAATLVDDQVRSQTVRPLVGPFYLVMLLCVGIMVILIPLRLRYDDGVESRRFLIQFGTWTASLPAASLLVNLLPWWRFANPALGLFGGIVLIATIMAGIGLFRRWRDPAAPLVVVSGVTAATLAIDVVATGGAGYPLQLASLLGTQPQVGGRFYGLSNATFAMFAVSLLLVTAYGAERHIRRGNPRRAGLVVLSVAAVAVLLDGSPSLGADFGGPPALIVGFTLLAILVWRIPLTWLRVLAILGAGFAVSLGFSFIDYLRPPEQRSHMGRFIQSLLDGGGFEVISRKLSQSFFNLPWTVVAFLIAIVAVVVTIAWRVHVQHRGRSASRAEAADSSSGSFVAADASVHADAVGDPTPSSRHFQGAQGSATPQQASATPQTGDADATTSRSFRTGPFMAAWRDLPLLRESIVAVGATLAVGFFINDSGIVVPTLGAIVAIPLWAALVARYADARSATPSAPRKN
ncbi:hypothetical protein [Actinobaculum sp. 352]|uniref:hypothetical protein n=1 Tax=Actinobaculum sp. 352 TaxID=2490946 RepID=UPI000F7E35F6|nr:hypothetical protein [Actinobaculum sp. 352]RTE49179.1 hypothetical protein EKN07_06260 [Actinobaculum sp. 352]